MVSSYVGCFIGFGMGFDLFCGRFGGGEVVEAAQVNAAVNGGGVFGFDGVDVSNGRTQIKFSSTFFKRWRGAGAEPRALLLRNPRGARLVACNEGQATAERFADGTVEVRTSRLRGFAARRCWGCVRRFRFFQLAQLPALGERFPASGALWPVLSGLLAVGTFCRPTSRFQLFQGVKGRRTAQKSRECKNVANNSHKALLRCLRQS